MTVKLLTIHHLEFLSLNGSCTGSSDLHLSKCHIVGNHMSRLNFLATRILSCFFSFFQEIPLKQNVQLSKTLKRVKVKCLEHSSLYRASAIFLYQKTF